MKDATPAMEGGTSPDSVPALGAVEAFEELAPAAAAEAEIVAIKLLICSGVN